MKKLIFEGANWEFPFMARVPDETKENLPIIFQLHGAGERGNGGEELWKVEVHGLCHVFTDEKNYECILIEPQCPIESFWVAYIQEINSFIDKVCEYFKADLKKVYLTGLSMGGFGTWYTAMAFPNKFAAIVPICGGGMPWNAAVLKMPVWAFHGMEDDLVLPSNTIDMVNALKKAGRNVKMSLFEDVGHGVWVNAYNDELVNWLLSKSL